MFLPSKEVKRKARANHNCSNRTSRAGDVVVDRVDDLHVSCATARTTWYMTALTGSGQGRPSRRSRNRETDFLDPNAHKLWRSGET